MRRMSQTEGARTLPKIPGNYKPRGAMAFDPRKEYLIVKQRRYFFGPTANRLCADRTYITPSDKAGVAINNSPIELVAMWAYFRPAVMTSISPSSFER